ACPRGCGASPRGRTRRPVSSPPSPRVCLYAPVAAFLSRASLDLLIDFFVDSTEVQTTGPPCARLPFVDPLAVILCSLVLRRPQAERTEPWRASASASHPRRRLDSGTLDRYGFRSRIGVPSSMSTPRTRSAPPSRSSSSTTVRPIGFGRLGERVAKTPCRRPLSAGGVAVRSNPSERSKTHST